MKKTIISYAVASTLIAGIIFTGCQSASQKEEAAKEAVQEAKEELKDVRDDANKEAQKLASAEEWIAFKTESDEKFRNNEIDFVHSVQSTCSFMQLLPILLKVKLTCMLVRQQEINMQPLLY